MYKFNEKILDKLEDRLIQAMLGEVEVPASAQEILRRVLQENGRLVMEPEKAEQADEDLPTPEEMGIPQNIVAFRK